MKLKLKLQQRYCLRNDFKLQDSIKITTCKENVQRLKQFYVISINISSIPQIFINNYIPMTIIRDDAGFKHLKKAF